jgi:hypothetical protein
MTPLNPPHVRPPRFGLKALLWSVTLVAVSCALFSYLGSHAMVLLVLLALAIFAHVAGNAVGTRLRALGDMPPPEQRNPSADQDRKLVSSDFAPTTRLRQRSPLGRPIAFVTAAGAVLGGVLGGILFVRMMGRPVTVSNIALGVTAAAVLGGIWTFVATSFLQVAGSALWQATKEPKR